MNKKICSLIFHKIHSAQWSTPLVARQGTLVGCLCNSSDLTITSFWIWTTWPSPFNSHVILWNFFILSLFISSIDGSHPWTTISVHQWNTIFFFQKTTISIKVCQSYRKKKIWNCLDVFACKLGLNKTWTWLLIK